MRSLFIGCLGLGVLVWLAYANSLSGELVLDSAPIIAGDRRFQASGLNALLQIFTRDYWWPTRASDLYRPLSTLSYWFNYTVLGGETSPQGYHIVNTMLHWANACLVLALVRRLTGAFAVAVVAAAVFAVHPIQTEAVANIVGRADLLATLAVLASCVLFVDGTAQVGAARRWRLGAAAVVAFAGILAKENAIVAAPLAALCGLVVVGRAAARSLAFPFAATFAPAVVGFAVIRLAMARFSQLLTQVPVDNPIAAASWFDGFMTAWKVVGRAMWLFVYPVHLSADYSYKQIPLYGVGGAWQDAQSWLAIAAFVLLAAVAVRWRQRRPLVAWAIAWTLLALIPTSNLLVTIGTIFGERLLYLPSVGAAALAGVAIVAVADRVGKTTAPRLIPWLPAAVVLALCVSRTHLRNRDWRDELSLWSATRSAASMSYRAHLGYSNALLLRDQSETTVDAAIESAERARAILEDPPLPLEWLDAGALLTLGIDYRIKAQRVRARGALAEGDAFARRSVETLLHAAAVDSAVSARALRLARGTRAAEIRDIGSPAVYVELATSHFDLREWGNARNAARRALQLAPTTTRAYAIAGSAAYYEADYEDAAVNFAAALLLEPEITTLWLDLERTYSARNATAPVVRRSGYAAFDTTNAEGRRLIEDARRLTGN